MVELATKPKRRPKFHVFEDAAGQWRWHLKSANGRILCQGESHPTKAKAKRAIAGVKRSTVIA